MNRKILVVATIVVMASMACGAMAAPVAVDYTYTRFLTGGYQLSAIATDNDGDVWTARSGATRTEVVMTKYTAGSMALESVITVAVPSDPLATAVRIAHGGIDFNSLDQMVLSGYDGKGTKTLVTATQTGSVVSQYDMSGQGMYAGVAVDNDDNVWFAGYEASTWSHTVILTDKDDGSIIQDSSNDDLSGAGLSWYFTHYGVAVDENGLVYVNDYTRVMRFDPCDIANTAVVIAGNPDRSPGTGPGEFGYGITGIAVVNGKLFVGDPANQRVQMFDAATGEYIQELTELSLTTIDDVAVDRAGNIYLAQSGATPAIHRWSVPFVDSDGDGVHDAIDECPGTPPGAQVDAVGCALPDEDGDGVADSEDQCPGTPPGSPVNSVGCTDSDGDGVADTADACPDTPPGDPVDSTGCTDSDGDGVPDTEDQCPGTPPQTPVDADGCPFETKFISVLALVEGIGQWGDYNNDGYSDMFGGTSVYTNQGNGSFVHTTPLGRRSNGSMGDFNNDGLLDAFDIVVGGGPVLHINNGDETWTDRTDWFSHVWGDVPSGSSGSTVVDLNGDGFLDTYMTGWWNNDATSADVIYTSYSDGVSDPCWRRTWAYGPPWQQKGVTPCDFDEDGDQDLYVSGYWMDPGSLWRNDGFNGTTGLTNVASAYGVNDGPGHTQGSCWADFDNDGHFDLFIANLAHPGNPQARFMENQGEPDYNFTDKGLCGLTQVEPLSCGIAGDYDNDGYVDILITVSGGYSWTTIMMYRNNGDFTFTEVTGDVGLAGQGPQDIGAWGDYNNDGYLDLIAADQLWRNPGGGHHWLKVKLLGGPHPDGLVNGSAIGAQVRIDVPGLGTLTRQVEGNTGVLGCQNDQVLHFGLGSYSGATVDLDISWPNGYQETIYDVPVDQPAPIIVRLGGPANCAEVITIYRLDGDFDSSCDVTFDDLLVLVGLWLADCGVEDCSVVDIDGTSTVDLDDFARYAENLGLCNTPGDEGCIENW